MSPQSLALEGAAEASKGIAPTWQALGKGLEGVPQKHLPTPLPSEKAPCVVCHFPAR